MRKKIFILGVGAQKAGTTWLHSQLASNSNIDMGIIKEYHVFDTLFIESRTAPRKKLIERVMEKYERNELGRNINLKKRDKDLALRLSFIDDTENYFNHFDYLHLKNTNIEAVGDITPSYSMLNSDAFNHIKDGLEKRGFEVKVIFLMRDPIERLWSLSRMMKRNEKSSAARNKNNKSLEKIYNAPSFETLTRYENTIKELENVFDTKNIHYAFYESLFTEESFSKITSFLGVKIDEPDFGFKVNESPKTSPIDEALAKKVAEKYRQTYKFTSEKFGENISKLWHGYKYL